MQTIKGTATRRTEGVATGDAVIASFFIAVNFDVALMGLPDIWTTVAVTALLIAIHRVPSLETDVSKDTQKLVSRLIGTLPQCMTH